MRQAARLDRDGAATRRKAGRRTPPSAVRPSARAFVLVPGLQEPPQGPVGPAGQADEALRMCLQLFHASPAAAVRRCRGRGSSKASSDCHSPRRSAPAAPPAPAPAASRPARPDRRPPTIWQPTMGCTPSPAASVENSSAANIALVSVTATAGIAGRRGELDEFLHRHRPFEKRMLGMDAQVDESRRGHGRHPSRPAPRRKAPDGCVPKHLGDPMPRHPHLRRPWNAAGAHIDKARFGKPRHDPDARTARRPRMPPLPPTTTRR